MEQYNKTQVEQIIRTLENRMMTASGKTFDRMERARRDLKNWDGTGALPHEKTLLEMNILGGASATGKVFISYSWDNENHKDWVRYLAVRLRKDGVDVLLDQWSVAPGDSLPIFMERAIRESDFVLCVCTPEYKRKSERRSGGVGYEGDIITSEFISSNQMRKFIPVLRSGNWNDAAPSWLSGKYYVDLRGDPFGEKQYQDLLAALLSPREIAYKSEAAFEAYRRELGKGQNAPLLETKIILVGQGSVGKTSLVQRMLHRKFDKHQEKTEGINIHYCAVEIKNDGKAELYPLSLSNRKTSTPIDIPSVETSSKREGKVSFPLTFPITFEAKEVYDHTQKQTKNKPQEDQETLIRLNIWDFGGQEIMHATHQFFLTKRSLYLLVLDSRLTQEENRVEYWLKIIQSFGGESPVLIVGNKIDQHPLDIDRTGLQKKYPNIVGILETSAATGAGIGELKAAITEQVNNLPHVRDLLPETWFTVKTKLEELGKQSNFITHDKYLDLCAENEVSDETSQRTLIGFLHDLGVVLHFQDDPRLEALGILNPQWVTNGVYKILNSHALFQNKGVLATSMLDEILNLPEYPRGKRLFIVDMMKKFELCYDIEPDKTFLVPDLLPKDQPDLNFNGIPAFEYAYPVLPSSVITRFIVRMNQKIDDGLVWRTGAVLKIGENKALIKADIEDRKITIAIDGVEYSRRDALSAIRYELGEIHNSIKGLNPQQRVPVPNAPLAEPLKYEYLLKLERAGQETILVENGNDLVTVNVRQMLSAIESEAQRRENTPGSVTTNYFIQGDVNASGDFVGRDKSISAGDNSIVVGGNVSDSRISTSYKKIESAEVDPELKQTLKSLTEAITTVVQSFPEEKTTKVVKNFERLVEEVTQPEPDPQWYSVSIEGLIKAAENLDKLGTPVISLSRKVLSLLTGGVVK